ncbi:MAG: ExbD/TolR family protein [Akkermansiaceae bacterium]
MSSSISLLFFMGLPLPLKIATLFLGGFFMAGQNVVDRVPIQQVQEDQAADKAEVRAVVRAHPVQPAKQITIMVNSDGSYNIGDEKLTAEQLGKKLKALAMTRPGSSVSLKADALTPHQMVANGMKLCKQSGITNVTFASKAAKP